MGSNFEWSPEKGWLFLQILSPLTGPSSFFLCSELTLKKKKKKILSPIWWESLPSEQPKILVLGRGSLFLQFVV